MGRLHELWAIADEQFARGSMWWWALVVGVLAIAGLILTVVIHRADKQESPAARPLRILRGLVLPLLTLSILLTELAGLPREHIGSKLLQTTIWVVIVLAILTLLRAWMIAEGGRGTWRGRAPRLFVDLVTVSTILLGIALVLSVVWKQNIGGLVAALGIGTIVVGLALQDTLGNLIAGVGLLFERPYNIGDWVSVGDTTGEIVEVNWRAIRLRTRQHEMLVVPNSVMAKEIFRNFTSPSTLHVERLKFGFSYNDPPNTVKSMLRQAARATPGVLGQPEPTVRTMSYDDFSISYEVRLFVDDFEAVPEILDRYRTRIWYAAKRSRVSIPFPIQRVQVSRAEPEPLRAVPDWSHTLRSVPIFAVLDPDDLKSLAETVQTLEFGHDEPVVREGDSGDALYVIVRGSATVRAGASEVGRLQAGDFFGEMAILTGEPRSATVLASQDLLTLVIASDDLRTILERRPELAEAMAQVVATRQRGLDELNASAEPAGTAHKPISGSDQLVRHIRHFFGLA